VAADRRANRVRAHRAVPRGQWLRRDQDRGTWRARAAEIARAPRPGSKLCQSAERQAPRCPGGPPGPRPALSTASRGHPLVAAIVRRTGGPSTPEKRRRRGGASPAPAGFRLTPAQCEAGRLAVQQPNATRIARNHQMTLTRRGGGFTLPRDLDRETGLTDVPPPHVVQEKREPSASKPGRGWRWSRDPDAHGNRFIRVVLRPARGRPPPARNQRRLVAGDGAPDSAQSGSFRPLPVIVDHAGPGQDQPLACVRSRPATLAEEAARRHRFLAGQNPVAARISRSVTA